ncbi:MAG: hypothetical protein HY814_03870, partial [Candidatus Riflebacteria bacterium]|nr:hypothetical protein [Candidatus Riflebacteria bacterium]
MNRAASPVGLLSMLLLILSTAPAAAAAVRQDVLAATSYAMEEALKAALEAEKATAAAGAEEDEAQSWVKASLYAGVVDYSGAALKRSASFAGAYGYFGVDRNNLVELAFDRLSIDFGASPTQGQRELSLVYTNFSDPGWKLRLGGHTVDSDRTLAAGGTAALVGLYHYEPGRFEVGFDLFHSEYPDATPRVAGWQVSPRVGLAVGAPAGG